MPTPAQPAPVTPPPEWAVKAALAIDLRWFRAYYDGHKIQDGEIAAIIARHAPPPAPSAPARSQSGEGVEQLKNDADSHHRMCSRLWDALGGDAMTDYSTPCDVQVVKQRDAANARIASLEAELAEYSKLLAKRTQDAIGWDGPGTPLPPSLRAAPSAVAKDRAEVVERLKHARTGFLTPKDRDKAITDAISLLSQPAVAQERAT